MISEPAPADPNAPRPRLGVRDRGGPPSGKPRGKGRPGGPKPGKGPKGKRR